MSYRRMPATVKGEVINITRRWDKLSPRQKVRRWLYSLRPRPQLPALREGAFPVYPLIWHPTRTRRTCETDPNGRLIGVEYTFDYQPSEEEFQAELGREDVVWIPLYTGTINAPPRDTGTPRAEFEGNLRAIAELGPRVRALLVGNANAEIHFDLPRQDAWARTVAFVESHGELIRAHGRPAFAPIFENLVYDCYVGEGKLRDAVNAVDALTVSFAGCTWLFEKKNPRIPEDPPYPRLAAYLRTLHAWSGVGLQRGLDAGSDRVLSAMGYRAGIMGYF